MMILLYLNNEVPGEVPGEVPDEVSGDKHKSGANFSQLILKN
jgi:hypothetical protein